MNFNMQKNKTRDNELDPKVRNGNFLEVSKGYTLEQAQNEAGRCLNCKNPACVSLCPVNVQIPKFIGYIREGNFLKAYETVKETNSLPAICGRVCPQENQCESKCIRGIKDEPVAIGKLERFCADWQMGNCKEEKSIRKSNGVKVAVLGSGPAGLTCAGDLNKLGYDVTIFEALHKFGGVLSYGIPEFRLPKKIVQKEIEKLVLNGVKIEKNIVAGKTVDLNDLKNDGFKAVFIGTGAGLPQFLNIPGENLNGVFSANEYLTRINLMKAYENGYDTPIFKAKNTVVIGGGNVAIDAARCALRMGSAVKIVYRRTKDEMPAREEEIHHAVEEGIEIMELVSPVQILGAGKVEKLECIKTEICGIDEKGRKAIKEIENSNFTIDTDCVIVAIGTKPNPTLTASCKDLKVNNHGCIIVDEHNRTSLENIYAGGDAVSGAATVILAMGAGKTAAKAIDEKLSLSKN